MLSIVIGVILFNGQVRTEPLWAKIIPNKTDKHFTEIRKSIEAKYGVPTTAMVDPKIAIGMYSRNGARNSVADAFKAGYAFLATDQPENYSKELEPIWSILPKNDWETLRLHFLCDKLNKDNVTDVGDRLLKHFPNDLELLTRMAVIRTAIKPDQKIATARKYADQAFALRACSLTYFTVGWTRLYDGKGNPSPGTREDAATALHAMQMFLKIANKNDHRIPIAKDVVKTFTKKI
ncbi:hypothetical protein BH11ARM1_BH11ARM1_04240 [soil metagenome]